MGTARDLATRGVDVTLLERGGLGGGTSGRSHGVLHSGARYARSDPDDAASCRAESRILTRIAGDCIAPTGGMFVQLVDDDPTDYDARLAACGSVGIDATPMAPEAIAAAIGGPADHIARAFAVPDGIVWPSRLIAATALDAEAHGASVHTHAPVEAVATDGDRITAVDVGGHLDARITADHVVNATGAWAPQLAALAGIELRMRPTRGVMIAVAHRGLERVLNRCRPPADGDIIVPHGAEVVLGTTSVAVDGPEGFERADWERERVRREADALLPGVAEAPRERIWWGVRPLYAPRADRPGGRGISRGFSVIDHRADGCANMHTVIGGKLTTHRRMAEATADAVCDRLGVDAACVTATRRLPAATQPARLAAALTRFDAVNPTGDTPAAGPTA